MQYPLISEYVRAIQDAASNLDKLAHLETVADKHGEPYRSSGAFAVVFKMRDPKTGRCYALKCFTEEQEGRAEAYRRIADELETVDSSYVTTVKYYEGELFVDSPCDDDCFPVLLMDWIEGETMEAYIAAHWRDSYAMSMLCYRFCRMAAWLRSQPFAHGDIKPDNVMVREDGTLALVDYDGMFVPAMKGQKSPTIGTKDFSHPLRTVEDFDETIDDFALASIALSLKAMSLDVTLREKYGAADRLLFSAADYRALGKSAVLAALQPLLTDADLATLLSMSLLAWSKKDLSQASFRLFALPKPSEPEILRTDVTEADLAEAVTDEYGVKYSPDGLRLLEASIGLSGRYAIKPGTKIICDKAFNGSMLASIEIPNSVTCIGDGAFMWCHSLTSITIPDSVTCIGDNAFWWCYSLTSITIPDNVTSIGDSAFAGCSKLVSIAIPRQLKSIANDIFMYSSISSITIPNSVTSIGSGAFCGCSSLSNIIIPNSVTSIGEGAFCGCWSLSNITIPNGVTVIGNRAFCECRSLTNIAIPSSVTVIDDLAFLECESLTSIVIPDSVTSIGAQAFAGCSKLVNIIIPDSVMSIGEYAFSSCKLLESILIADSQINIGNGAFSYCSSLSSITIPASVMEMKGNPFCNWNGELINMSSCFSYEDGVLFSKNKDKLIAFRRNDATSYAIPDSVTNIGNGAFSGCSMLKSITVPDSVTCIGDGAFMWCHSLTSITIPDSVTSIGFAAFWFCSSLTSIIIPDSVTIIGGCAFQGCSSLTSIVIPDSVTDIGYGAFCGCCSLCEETMAEIERRYGYSVFVAD